MTGNMPGIAASTNDTCELGSPPNSVDAPENSLALEVTWAWISIPITTSQPPSAPLINFDVFAAALMRFVQSMTGGPYGGPQPSLQRHFGKAEKPSSQIEIPAQRLFCDIDRIDKFLEFDDPPALKPHDVGDPEIQNSPGSALGKAHVGQNCRPVPVRHHDIRHIAFEGIIFRDRAKRLKNRVLALPRPSKAEQAAWRVNHPFDVIVNVRRHPIDVATHIGVVKIRHGRARVVG